MKRMVTLFVLILSVLGCISAASWASLEKGEEKDNANVPMSLDLTVSGSFNSVLVGFSDSAVTSFQDVVTGIDSYDLEIGEDGRAEGSGLYVFYQIFSAQPLDVTLYAGTPLRSDTNAVIYYDVVGNFVKDGSSVVFIDGVSEDGGVNSIPQGFGDVAEGVYVYRHRPDVKSMGAIGSYQLTVTTEDVMDKEINRYYSNLTVRVDSV